MPGPGHEAALTPDRRLALIGIPDTLTRGAVFGRLAGDIAFAPEDDGVLRLAYRLVSPAPTSVRIGSGNSGGESPGFITSRVNVTIGNEAFFMLMEGVASARDIDKALKLGLIDQVVVNLVPVVFGSGRPFFATGGLAETLAALAELWPGPLTAVLPRGNATLRPPLNHRFSLPRIPSLSRAASKSGDGCSGGRSRYLRLRASPPSLSHDAAVLRRLRHERPDANNHASIHVRGSGRRPDGRFTGIAGGTTAATYDPEHSIGDARLNHADRSQQHRQRDRQRGEERCPEVPEQNEQHHDHEDRAEEQVVLDGRNRLVN